MRKSLLVSIVFMLVLGCESTTEPASEYCMKQGDCATGYMCVYTAEQDASGSFLKVCRDTTDWGDINP
jgi:hypothetical protein